MILKNKSVSPLIATILLVVVAVVLVTILLNFGKEFTISSLEKTNSFSTYSESDASNYIYKKQYNNNLVSLKLDVPSEDQINDVTIIAYSVIGYDSVLDFDEDFILKNNSENLVYLDHLDSLNISEKTFDIQLYTDDNKFILIKELNSPHNCQTKGDGTQNNPYVLCTAEDLNNVRNNMDANYVLGKNIDLYYFLKDDLEGWVPIGSSTS